MKSYLNIIFTRLQFKITYSYKICTYITKTLIRIYVIGFVQDIVVLVNLKSTLILSLSTLLTRVSENLSACMQQEINFGGHIAFMYL